MSVAEGESEMQGVVFMPQNPQQGSPPPNNPLGELSVVCLLLFISDVLQSVFLFSREKSTI